MFFAGHAQTDGKTISGLETAHDQIALFQAMSLDNPYVPVLFCVLESFLVSRHELANLLAVV